MSNRLAQFDFLLTPNSARALGTAEFYLAGTTTQKYVYGVADGTDPKYTATFDASGVLKLWGLGNYKVVIKNAGGTTLYTIDGYRAEAVNSNVVSVSGAYQVTANDDIVLLNAASAGFIVILPHAADATHPISFKKIDTTANAVTINCKVSESVDGASSLSLSTPYVAIELFSNGSNWYSTSGSAVNADTVDGYHAGNTSGAVPISNGTVNVNLNADMVDGYGAGNASGQVAVSNTTLCSDLNADLLDSQQGSYYTNADNMSSGTLATARMAAGTVIKVDYTTSATSVSGSATIPADNTKPQNTEGAELLTKSYTPLRSGSVLKITYTTSVQGGTGFTTALFTDSNADAIHAIHHSTTAAAIAIITMTHFYTTSSTSAVTFKVRGGSVSGNWLVNGVSSGDMFGGVSRQSLCIEEIAQ